MNADHAALVGQRLEHLVRQSRTRNGFHGFMAGDHGCAAGLDQLRLNRFGAVGDVDEDAEIIHLRDQLAAVVVDAAEVVRLLAALNGRERAVAERVEAGLRRKLNAPQAEPVESIEHIRIALMVEAGLAADEHRHAPAADDAPGIRRTERNRHLVGMRFGNRSSVSIRRSTCFGV